MKSSADLDAFLTEIQGEPVEITVQGRRWLFAAEIPAIVLLRLKAAAADPDYVGSDNEDIELLRAMMTPPTQVEDLLATGITSSGLELLIRVVMGVYAGSSPEDTLSAIRAERETAADTAGVDSGDPKDPA